MFLKFSSLMILLITVLAQCMEKNIITNMPSKKVQIFDDAWEEQAFILVMQKFKKQDKEKKHSLEGSGSICISRLEFKSHLDAFFCTICGDSFKNYDHAYLHHCPNVNVEEKSSPVKKRKVDVEWKSSKGGFLCMSCSEIFKHEDNERAYSTAHNHVCKKK